MTTLSTHLGRGWRKGVAVNVGRQEDNVRACHTVKERDTCKTVRGAATCTTVRFRDVATCSSVRFRGVYTRATVEGRCAATCTTVRFEHNSESHGCGPIHYVGACSAVHHLGHGNCMPAKFYSEVYTIHRAQAPTQHRQTKPMGQRVCFHRRNQIRHIVRSCPCSDTQAPLCLGHLRVLRFWISDFRAVGLEGLGVNRVRLCTSSGSPGISVE